MESEKNPTSHSPSPFSCSSTPQNLRQNSDDPDPGRSAEPWGDKTPPAPQKSIPGMRIGVNRGVPIPSVIGHDGEGPELAEFGIIFPFSLLITQPRPVDLRRQVPKNLVHLSVVDNLLGNNRRGIEEGGE